MFDGDELEEVVLPSSLRAADDVFPGDNTAFAASNEIPELLDVPARPAPAEVATFKHLCAGRDGKLCLFEDADGHLVAVLASRLA